MKRLIIVALLIFGIFDIAFAVGRGITTREYPWVMRSVAALGMGDAYYAKSDSKYAPFYNPAGLARIEKSKLDLIPITAGINHNFLDFYNDYNRTNKGNNAEIATLLASTIGELQHAELSFYPGYTRKNFTMGLFAASQINAASWNPIAPELNVDITADTGAVIGIANEFLDDRFQVGVAARYQRRYSFQRTFTVQDILSKGLENINSYIKNRIKDGWDIFFDLGVIYNIFADNPWEPRIAIAANNIGINNFGDAKELPWSLNCSFGISPNLGSVNTDIILDVRDVTRNFNEDDDWGKRINLGAEFRFLEIIALRGGLHQGWLTMGAGLDLLLFRLDYAYYTEEIGAYAGQKKDARHALEFVMGF